MRYQIGRALGEKEGGVMQVKQATSLRVEQRLYDRLARLARYRGTTITRQLEMAIRAHLEAAVVQEDLPVVQPAMERIISENLEATVGAKIEEMKERLAGLLAKTAMDTAVLYLLETRRWSNEERQMYRKAAADHVRGRLAELHSDVVTSEELAAMKGQVEDLKRQIQQRDKATAAAASQHQQEAERLNRLIKGLEQELARYRELLEWLEAEWDKPGLLNRRKPFRATLADYAQQTGRHWGA